MIDAPLPTIDATTPVLDPPTWAVLERHLFAVLDQSVYPYLERYTRADGELIFRDEYPRRDGADDFYESFYNWPLLYLLGGGDHLLELGKREWDAVTRQLTRYGHVHQEYERGYDQFHQAESYIYFYFLCLADPTDPVLADRARRFAGFYLGEDPAAPNYDPERRIIRAPHNGSAGSAWGFTEGEPSYGWSASMRRYGLPFSDVPGISHYDDLKDPALARRMGEVMHERLGRGDVAANLLVTSLVANAAMLTGDEKYRRWIVEYVDAWHDRADRNGGLLPDNVGLSGVVGEYTGGRWYGGLYGWTWPHGFYNIGMAAIVAGTNAFLLTGDERHLDLPRIQIQRILDLGERRDVAHLEMSLVEHWVGQVDAVGEKGDLFVVPYRHGDEGWFDFQPMSPIYPAALWNVTRGAADWQTIETLRQRSGYDWRAVGTFRTKEDAGHEEPWLRFLAGDNPSYPEAILRESLAMASWRLDLVRADRADLTRVHIHWWQQRNPVLTEALIQLTLGAPQIIYNGGLLHAPVRYFDAARRRPGLPPDVAALVTAAEAERTVVELVNLSPTESRALIVQAGAFGEHRFRVVRYDGLADGRYPGEAAYSPPEPATEERSAVVNGRHLAVRLPPGRRVTLDLAVDRSVNAPTYAGPFG